jgi:hypothetical protein
MGEFKGADDGEETTFGKNFDVQDLKQLRRSFF